MVKYTKEMFVLEKPDFDDISEWDIIAGSSLFDGKLQNKESEKEIIFGYANALNCITDKIQGQNHDIGNMIIIRSNSLAMPFVFLARHTLELCLKYLCVVLNIKYEHKHGLIVLWNKISEKLYKPSQRDYFNGLNALLVLLKILIVMGHIRDIQKTIVVSYIIQSLNSLIP